MPLEVVYGESRNRRAASALASQLEAVVPNGTIYLGYPVLATADQRVEVDALLVSSEHGLVAFLLADSLPNGQDDWEGVVDTQDRLFAVLESHLGRHESLRSRRSLLVPINTATIFPAPPSEDGRPADADGFYGTLETIAGWVAQVPAIPEYVESRVHAALQRVTTIKPRKKRTSVQTESSRGAVLKDIEKGIANLDRWQKAAAIESPEGPQRIRGLAGSGKTVVLALKAAYWHSQHPDWRIALTFHSRALYQQIDDLVTRFTFEHTNDRPDETQLKIMHSWGSRSRAGVYSMMAAALNVTPRDWSYARGTYGSDEAFRGICRELLTIAEKERFEPIFDAVLIDEAQDLPPEFFQLVYLFTRDPKRIVWGYDELQKLSESAMPTTDELFGTDSGGRSRISLESGDSEPRRDIVLPVCYRNTPWALAVAHALGVGVYRPQGLVQHPDEPDLWKDIGYNVINGRLALGESVTLARSQDSYPEYFDELLTLDDAVVVQAFSGQQDHDHWVAQQIAHNLTKDELEHDDILIVLPDSYRAKSRAPKISEELWRQGIPSHLVGVNTSVDEVFRPGSVAIAHIYRAKGNEAPMVYAVDAHHANSSFNVVTRRNTLFTAITRSRAWVRICGWGPGMAAIANEAGLVEDNNYRLEFTIPTEAELASLRHVHRDRPDREEENVRRAAEGLATYLSAVERGEVDFYDLPPDIRTKLISAVQPIEPSGP